MFLTSAFNYALLISALYVSSIYTVTESLHYVSNVTLLLIGQLNRSRNEESRGWRRIG